MRLALLQFLEWLLSFLYPLFAQRVWLDPIQADKVGTVVKTTRQIVRPTQDPVLVGMIGLTGAGKSTVARKLGDILCVLVLDSNAFRCMLREQELPYGKLLRQIIHDLAEEYLAQGMGVIIDADHISFWKRVALRALGRKYNVPVRFVRVTCHFHQMIGRVMTNPTDAFYAGIAPHKVKWEGTADERSKIIKLNEMLRHLVLHCQLSRAGGGMMEPRRLPKHIINIDTTSLPYDEQVEWAARKIRR